MEMHHMDIIVDENAIVRYLYWHYYVCNLGHLLFYKIMSCGERSSTGTHEDHFLSSRGNCHVIIR